MRLSQTVCVAAALLTHRSRAAFQVLYEPGNPKQSKYVDYLHSSKYPLIIAEGPAGTGKTLLACQSALQQLHEKRVQKIVITRPTVAADEGIGFLRGGLTEKMSPWMAPVMDIFREYYTKEKLKQMVQDDMLEIAPITYLRGRTFKSCFLVADEMQNATPTQMKMVLTRLGENSRFVITGDVHQSDLRGRNGLKDLMERLENTLPLHEVYEKGISVIRFDASHIQRHPLLKVISKIYGDE